MSVSHCKAGRKIGPGLILGTLLAQSGSYSDAKVIQAAKKKDQMISYYAQNGLNWHTMEGVIFWIFDMVDLHIAALHRDKG
jgi:hypothetical protein